jgi:polysaccharide biosynthesis protein PelC
MKIFQLIFQLHSLKLLCVLLTILWLSACTVVDAPKSVSFDSKQRWVLLPIQNQSSQPQAGEQVEAVLGAVLRTQGLTHFDVPPNLDNDDTLPELDEQQRYKRALEWARKKGYTLGITGSVEEWHYKSGIEGEPAVALVIQVVDIANGQVVWNAVGARSGWGRESLSGTGQKLIRQLLASMQIRSATDVAR